MPASRPFVVSVHANRSHSFSKLAQLEIRLLEGLGVEGDAHCGATVKHRSRVARDPSQPNLRQVHLIHCELFTELADHGQRVVPGALGENITTSGIALLDLPTGTRLHIGDEAIVEVTGLRNPCAQIERFQSGLLAAVLGRTEHGQLIRKTGVMGIVITGGTVRPNDGIAVRLPTGRRQRLECV